MSDFQLFEVADGKPNQIALPAGLSSIHEVLDGWPTGVYTVFRTFHHNRFLSLEEHLDRLDRSMASLGYPHKLDRSQLKCTLDAVCSAYPLNEAQVRLDILSDEDRPADQRIRTFITLGPLAVLTEDAYTHGVVVGTTSLLRREDPLVKSASFVIQRRAFLEKHPELHEVLLVDQDDHILEGASSSFFGVRINTLITAQDGILMGTARQIVLKVAADLGIGVHYRPVNLDAVRDLDEAAISSSSRGIVPVVQIDQTTIGSGRPGETVKRLMAAYQEAVDGAVKPAI